ncbi:hypothetical protein KKC13_06495 [bacterium]|nr:hypothetical protein [bacterium]MBU1957446.1 hypothetical protein [bacterium]
MKNLLIHFIFFLILLFVVLLSFYFLGKNFWYPYYKKCFIEKEIEPCIPTECNRTHIDSATGTIVMEKNCTEAPNITLFQTFQAPKISSDRRLKHLLADSDFIIYPKQLTLIGLKNEQILEVWGELNGKQAHIESYQFTAFSGQLGPKFKEGDRQIPEGIYGISYLNPNSKFHLSMRVNYPNDFDKKMARLEKRTNLGSDIMIHGSDKTIGCVPIGDDAIEELYFLAQKVGIKNIKVILSPVDFRTTKVKIKNDNHPWLKELYANITKEMQPFISK